MAVADRLPRQRPALAEGLWRLRHVPALQDHRAEQRRQGVVSGAAGAVCAPAGASTSPTPSAARVRVVPSMMALPERAGTALSRETGRGEDCSGG